MHNIEDFIETVGNGGSQLNYILIKFNLGKKANVKRSVCTDCDRKKAIFV